MSLSPGARRTSLYLGVAAALLLALTGGLLFRESGAPRVPAERPRPARGVVLLLASGLGGDRTLPHTPALAGLAAAGRRFEGAFAASPKATEARQALLRGLSSAFRAEGASVARVGPGLGPPRWKARWDLSLPGAITDPAAQATLAEWLTQRRTRRFLLVASVGPAPGAASDGRPDPEPGRPAPPLPRIASTDLAFEDRPGLFVQPPSWTSDSRDRAAAASLAKARAADRDLRSALEFLESAAPGDELAIVVLGDPHPDLGQHGVLVRRDALFDTTLRIDLVVTAPGLPRPGTVSSGLVTGADVLPTLLDLAGYPPAPGSTSLVPQLADPDAASSEGVVSSVARRAGGVGRSVRTARYRYTEWPDGSEELYDHASDPPEHLNLAADPGQRAAVESLREILADRRQPAVGAAAAPAAVERPRNVLLIVVDDLNTQVGPWGSSVLTPNIDRLARRGVRFEHAYVQVAMCSPSRASFLNGWRPERTRVWSNVDPPRPAGAVPLQEHFADHGYFTASVGKVFHEPALFRWDWRDGDSSAPARNGADRRRNRPDSRDDESTAPGGKRPSRRRRNEDREPWTRAEGGDASQPDGLRARAAARLLEQPRDRPFFLAVGFVRPHLRWVAPARYFDLYAPEAVTLPPDRPEGFVGVPAIAIKSRPQVLPGLSLQDREPAGLVRNPSLRRQYIAAYQACVSFVDAQVGVILDALDRADLWEDTLVVLVSDNGFHLGEHDGLFRKDTLFEGALRVPLILAAPGAGRPGAAVSAPVELLDLYPTVVALAGLPAVPGIDGRSLAPLLEDPDAPGWQAALSYRRVQSPGRGWSLRTERARYTLWPDGSEELYDHDTDPDELRNLADRDELAALKSRLRRSLEVRVGTRPEAPAP
jgi:iduronate 2-sulfatase